MSEWTKTELQLLQDNYETLTMPELVTLIGKSESAIRGKKSRLGLVKTNRPFTQEEINILVDWYENRIGQPAELDELSKILGRNKQIISRKARKLGLTNPCRPSTDEQKEKMSKGQRKYAREHPLSQEQRVLRGIRQRGEHYGDVKYKKLRDTWRNMQYRCFNKSNRAYHNYGGRGISVCDEWQKEKGFLNFYKWALKNGYEIGLTLDRIDNDGDYSPHNCRWVSRKTQCRNKRTNVKINYQGKSLTIVEWCEELNIPSSYMRYHIARNRDLDEIQQRYFNYKSQK